MKNDPKRNFLEKESVFEFVDRFIYQPEIIKRSIPNLSSEKLSSAQQEMFKEIEEKLFEGQDKFVGLDEFIIKSLSIPIMIACISVLENFFQPIVEQMEKRSPFNMNTLSLKYVTRFQKLR